MGDFTALTIDRSGAAARSSNIGALGAASVWLYALSRAHRLSALQ
jgi:hypothetical protein